VSQHLKVLKQAGLVREVVEGTRRIYHIDPRGVGAMRDWLDSHWRGALASFQKFADTEFEKEQE
jgi:DNA-binding transcriptional ArsR family regulator